MKGCRIAWTPDFGMSPVDPEVRAISAEAARAFEDLGAHVEEIPVSLPATSEAFGIAWYLSFTRLRKFFPQEVWKENLSAELYKFLWLERDMTAEDLDLIGAARSQLWDYLCELFRQYDYILSPVITVEPFSVEIFGPEEVDGTTIDPFSGWMLTWPFNWSGHPAASLPCGFTKAGLPVGLQIAGRPQREETVFQAAHAFEQARPWAQRRPKMD